MKKTIAILLVLVIGMVGVWAAIASTTSQSLELSTAIPALNVFAITAEDYSESTFSAVFGASGFANPEATTTERLVDIDDGITSTFLTIGTNKTSGFAVYLNSASKMTINGTGTGTAIDYAITVGDDAVIDTKGTITTVQLVDTVSAVSGTGANVESYAVLVDLDEESYYNAEANTGTDVYEATVVFGITAI